MKDVVNIEDLRKLAKKRLPKIAYDFIEGGTDDEVGLVTNEQAFRKARIVPRYLVDVSVRDQSNASVIGSTKIESTATAAPCRANPARQMQPSTTQP